MDTAYSAGNNLSYLEGHVFFETSILIGRTSTILDFFGDTISKNT